MEMQYFKQYSPNLNRDMECKVYGHAGRPVLFIPCQDGRFYDFENFRLTDYFAPYIESGQVMVFAIDTIDIETWSNKEGNPYWRNRRHEDWIRYITEEGYDSVATYRVDRKGEPPIRSWFARQFYKLINKMTEVEIVDGARDYRMMTRDMVNAIISMPEVHRFSKGIFTWVGFKTKYLEYENVERVAGETKWSFWKLFKYAIEGIVAFTTFPLRMATILGFLISFVGFVFMMYIAIKAVLFGDPVAGYPSLIVVITLIGGIQLLAVGVMGEYLAKTYMEVKSRPKYIVKRKL